MAKYYIDQTDQSNNEELQTVYTNAPTVSYVINSEDSQHGQSIIVGNDQFMVLENVIDQNTITLQNQFEIPAGQQQIYYMETDDNIQGIEAIQSQPVIMNSSIQQNATQKLIMVQQSQPSMIIQQPQMIQRTMHKQIQPRIQTPQQINVASPPRLLLTNQVRPGTINPRPTIQTKINIPRNPLQRTASPVQRAGLRPQLVPSLVQRRPIRAGVIQNDAPPLLMQGGNKSVVTRTQFTPKDIRKLVNASIATTGEILQTAGSSEEQSVEGESTVISMQEYQQLLADRKRAAENTNKMMNRIKNLNKKATIKIPLTRPTATAIQTQAKPQLLVNEEESTRLEKAGKRHQNARIIKPKDNNRLPAILRNFVPPPEIRDIISKTQHTLEFQNSIRMFVIHESGEQRLITFTMPKEDCTIQEILEQVGVPIAANTKIAISETNADGINLVVSVGIPVDDDIPEPESSIKNVPSSSAAPLILNSKGSLEIPPKVATPELSAPQENETPKYIQGMLAVCTHCGFLSDDFNKCIRCKSKLPDGIKAVPSSNFYKKGTDARVQKPTIAINLKNNGNVKPSTSIGIAKKKMKPKVVDQEPVILTLSSDDEDADESQSNNADQQTKKSESPISIPQEPSLNDFKENGSNEVTRLDIKEAGGKEALITAKLRCRTIRIGSYNIQAPDEIILNTKELILRIPSLEDNAIKSIKVPRTSVVKVLANFQKLVPVIFYYVAPSIGESIRNELHMTTGGEYYFDPVSNEETYKRITLLLDSVSEEIKWIFTEIYRAVGKFEELNVKDANIVLVKSSPRPIVKLPTITQASAMSSSEVRQLLIYPPGITGGLPINTEDYLCLAQDQFLNDVIIDFYLKYLVLNLPKESQDKIHVFSTFFYKRLTTKPTKPSRRTYPAEMDPLLTAAQKRHSRVKSWTKNVNLFEKDYVVVPINENAHWFLAIICFPGMNGAHTFDGKPYKIEQIEHKRRIVTNNLTLRQMKIEKAAATVNCDEGDLSDKDEAEGDESELDSNEDSDDAATTSSVKILQSESIKQPCILIFDSLAGASRARVVATLRDYLTCEHKIKQGTVKVFNKDVIKGACPKIPQQTNYTDCGLYLLQYVESFFQDPIKDYRLPISTLKLWFNELTVTKKREDISNLIKSLMVEYKKNVNILPILQFPTLNGELVETQPEEDEEEEEEEPMDEEEDEECDGPRDEVESENENVTSSQDTSLIKPSESSANLDTGFTEESVFNTSKVKPDMKEVPTISNRDTMSYLKSKRIIKHRVTDSSDIKKMRMAD